MTTDWFTHWNHNHPNWAEECRPPRSFLFFFSSWKGWEALIKPLWRCLKMGDIIRYPYMNTFNARLWWSSFRTFRRAPLVGLVFFGQTRTILEATTKWCETSSSPLEIPITARCWEQFLAPIRTCFFYLCTRNLEEPPKKYPWYIHVGQHLTRETDCFWPIRN